MSGIAVPLFLLLGAGLGGALVWLLLRSRAAVQAERLWRSEAERARLAQELERARLVQHTAQEDKLRLERALAAEQAGAAARLEELRTSHDRIKAEFAELSAAALRSTRDDFLKLAEQALGQQQQQSTVELERRQQAIDAVVKPLKESLEKVDAKVGELEKSRAQAYAALSEQLKGLGSAQASLQAEATRLATTLSSTRTAGTWGELQLRRVVELAGMVEHCDFVEQVSHNGLRPDLLVSLPGQQQVVVDAKAPTDAYREAAAATDPAVRAEKLLQHAGRVRAHIDALSAKAYWQQFQPSPEFVVLFLPGDQFLSAALEADPTLLDRGIQAKVLLATPSTLIALLKACAMGWRQEAISRHAEEVSQLGRQLYDRLATFAEHLTQVGQKLEAATTSYNQAIGSFESHLLPGARRFAELGAKGGKALPDAKVIELLPRKVVKLT